MTARDLNLLLIAPNCDGTDVGEAFCAHRWVEHLSRTAKVTLLTQARPGRVPPSAQLPDTEVIEWPELMLSPRMERFSAMLKPAYPVFAARAKRWIARALSGGRDFDLIHQLTPLALRYPSPAAGFGIPYVLGPQGGSLETPAAFARECGRAPAFTKLRALDMLRIKIDPWLRRSFARAACVVGVAPYVRELLDAVPVARFEVMSELGIDEPLPEAKRQYQAGRLRLLHVARAVRTKGLRDCVRALALLRDLPGVTLTQAGDGEELEVCKAEAIELGVADRVTFLGRVPRSRVEELYASSDAFVFPSFREPSGSVVFEAMRHGLPVVAADRGGPGHVVNGKCGMIVPADGPYQLSRSLAASIRQLAGSPELAASLSRGARARAVELGSWPSKVEAMHAIYRSIITNKEQERKVRS